MGIWMHLENIALRRQATWPFLGLLVLVVRRLLPSCRSGPLRSWSRLRRLLTATM